MPALMAVAMFDQQLTGFDREETIVVEACEQLIEPAALHRLGIQFTEIKTVARNSSNAAAVRATVEQAEIARKRSENGTVVYLRHVWTRLNQ